MRLIRNTVLTYMAGFALFCGLHLLLNNRVQIIPPIGNVYQTYAEADFSSGKRNIISAKRSGPAGPQAVDQKFEQVANIATASNNFEEEEAKARAQIKVYSALIQFEQRAGLEGYRTLQLAIGVTPENFDALVTDLKALGKLTRLQIDKTDKTNEYLDLQARKVSLEKSRDSLVELKKREGAIDELIHLETKILDLESQIQALGVSLGDFDAENEFSTVKLSLQEVREQVKQGKSLWRKLGEAFVWTIKYYTLLWIGLAASLIAIYVALKLIGMIIATANRLERSNRE